MRVVYNGIDLQVLETHDFTAEPVFDDTGTDYLYTRYSITVRAIINGQSDILTGTRSGIDGRTYQNGPVMSYRMGGASVIPASNNIPNGAFINDTAGFDNVGSPGGPGTRPNPYLPFVRLPNGRVPPSGERGMDLPATGRMFTVVPRAVTTNVTHLAIRQRLTTPRGQLFIFSGPLGGGGGPVEMMLASPEPDGGPGGSPSPCDARNGPFPRLLSVHQAFGDANTLMVDFSVETFVNEAWANGVDNAGRSDTTRGMVSNRFRQTHSITADGFTTIATEGTAIFRADILYRSGSAGSNPDLIRDQMFMPIPLGFKREDIKVEGLPEAFGVRYQYVDVQQPVNFPGGPPAQTASISVVHRQVLSSGDVVSGALSAYERVLGIKANKSIADSSKDETDKNKEGLMAPKKAATVSDFNVPPGIPGP